MYISISALLWLSSSSMSGIVEGRDARPDDIERDLQESTCENECVDRKDWIKRDGLGDSPGIPGIEYLGLGYNMLEGNPRGTAKSELDPGYRHRVVDIVQDQSRTTLDTDYMMPYGVKVLSASSCKFASTSVEISNEQQYTNSLSQEVSSKTSVDVGVQGSYKGVPAKLSASYAFSKSEKYQSYSEGTTKTRTVTYEAKAICTEFDLSLESFFNHTYYSDYEYSLKALPKRFDPKDDENKKQYYAFIDTFGTHVVTNVVLGAKHVFSSIIKSSDVLELTRNNVDIKSDMSFELQFSVGAAANEAKDTPQEKTAVDDEGTVIKVLDCRDKADAPTKAPTTDLTTSAGKSKGGVAGLGLSVGYSTSKTTETASLAERISMIQKKVKTVNEVNIGGSPPIDGNWKTWAQTVRERPMPVTLEVEGIWEHGMDEDQTKNFLDAILVRYGLDLSDESTSEVLQAMHFGLYKSDAVPISSYSTSSSGNYRFLLALQTFNTVVVQSTKIILHNGLDYKSKQPIGEPIDGGGEKSCPQDEYACGASIRYNKAMHANFDNFDQWKIFALKFLCCGVEDWDTQSELDIYNPAAEGEGWKGQGAIPSAWNDPDTTAKCPPGEFIDAGETRYANPDPTYIAFVRTGEQLGTTGLKIRCTGSTSYMNVYDDDETKDLLPGLLQKEMTGPTGSVVRGASVSYQDPNDVWAQPNPADNDVQAITGINFFFTPPETMTGPKHQVFLYNAIWETSDNAVTAFFVTMLRGSVVPHIKEDTMELVDTEMVKNGIYHPFGLLSLKDPSTTAFAIVDFNDKRIKNSLESLAVLAADNLPNEANFVAGVVYPLGYPVNEIFGLDNGYEVEQEDDGVFNVIFTNECQPSLDPFETKTPTFIAFPIWFDERFPDEMKDVTVRVDSCSYLAGRRQVNCKVLVGRDNNGDVRYKELGFSFLAIAEQPAGVVHGRYRIDETKSFKMNEAKTEAFGCTFGANEYSEDISGNFTGGINILFDKPFEAPPSVIVTPHLEGSGPGRSPFAVVEHVTKRQAFIKAGTWNSNGDFGFKPTSFDFVIVGPPAIGKAQPFKIPMSGSP